MTSPALPADSLAYSLLLAARAIAAVGQGRSLTDAVTDWRREPAAARAAAQDLAYGALRRAGHGDFILSRLLQKPLDDTQVHGLLLAALYRLETRPEAAHTVVDQAVQAATMLSSGRFKGLVNAVLRNALRKAAELTSAAAADEVATWRHPQWWLSRLQAAYPDDWQAIAAAGNQQPPMTLRVNLRHWDMPTAMAAYAEAGIPVRQVGPQGLQLGKALGVDALPGFAEGKVSVQDAGAQQAAIRLGAQAGERVLDACAAPGGKTAHILELADVDLLALDVDVGRCQRIDDNLQRLQLHADVRSGDGSKPQQWWDGKPFDRILADVPCSASGVVRRHPDAKWLRRADDIKRFAATQRRIVDALWTTLRPGGTLLYATCSIFPEENSEQLAAFLARHSDAIAGDSEQLLPTDDHDGFYYALLRKQA